MFFFMICSFSSLLIWEIKLLQNYDKFKTMQTPLLWKNVVEWHYGLSIDSKYIFYELKMKMWN